jgi:hypothetical protein
VHGPAIKSPTNPGYGLDLGPANDIGSQVYDIDLGFSFGDNVVPFAFVRSLVMALGVSFDEPAMGQPTDVCDRMTRPRDYDRTALRVAGGRWLPSCSSGAPLHSHAHGELPRPSLVASSHRRGGT